MKKYDTLIFDLDGTLAVSKRPLDDEMATLLSEASNLVNIVVITGGTFNQIKKQVIGNLTPKANMNKVYVLPASGSSMRTYNTNTDSWDIVYEHTLTKEQKELIISSIKEALSKVSFTIDPKILVGEQIEDRITQISFSALGQQQPIEVKEKWDGDRKKRLEMMTFLEHLENDFDVKIGGTTTIDITLKGIDKAFGINEFYKYTGLDIDQGLFVGDQIMPEGNDFAATKTAIDICDTSGPEETMNIIHQVLGEHN